MHAQDNKLDTLRKFVFLGRGAGGNRSLVTKSGSPQFLRYSAKAEAGMKPRMMLFSARTST